MYLAGAAAEFDGMLEFRHCTTPVGKRFLPGRFQVIAVRVLVYVCRFRG